MGYLFQTSRTGVRCLTLDDLDALMAIYANPKIMNHSIYGVLNTKEIQQLIADQLRAYEQQNYGLWAIVRLENQELLGCCGLQNKLLAGENLVTIAYRFCEHVWGQGLATEVVTGVLNYAAQVLNISPVYALIKPDNDSSKRVAKKVGLVYKSSTVYLNHTVEIYQWDNKKPE